jgi:hypothetical protein
MSLNSFNYQTKTISKAVKLNSLLIALLMSFNIINAVIDSLIVVDLEVGLLVGGTICISFIIFSLMNKDFSTNKKSLFLISYIIFAIVVSLPLLSFYDRTIDTFINFIFYGLISILIGSRSFDTQIVTRYTIYISLASIFTFGDLLNNYTKTFSYTRIDMGLSYALLPVVIAAIIHFIYYRKSANIFIWIGYIFNAYCLFLLIFAGSRGVLVSILFFFWFLSLNKFVYKKGSSEFINHRKLWFLFSSFLIIISLILFENIIVIVHESLSSLGIEIAFVEKNYYLLQSAGDISNNRMILYGQALEGIANSPVWGNGIGSFQYYTGVAYPHNIILELLYEGGLILATPIILILLIGMLKVLTGKIKSKDEYLYVVLLIASSMPRLMVSASFWSIQIFWLLVAFSVTRLMHKQ